MYCKCLSFVVEEIHVFTFTSLLFLHVNVLYLGWIWLKSGLFLDVKYLRFSNLRFSKFHSSSDMTEIFWFRSHLNLSKICFKSGVSVCWEALVVICIQNLISTIIYASNTVSFISFKVCLQTSHVTFRYIGFSKCFSSTTHHNRSESLRIAPIFIPQNKLFSFFGRFDFFLSNPLESDYLISLSSFISVFRAS